MKELWLVFLACCLIETFAARFAVTGPTLTVTLKDPPPPSDGTHNNNKGSLTPWLDLTALRPDLRWGIQSQHEPLPNWLPSLKAVQASLVYRYTELKRGPSILEGALKFSKPAGDLLVQPRYEVKSGRLQVWLQASRGPSYILTRLVNHKRRFIDAIQGSTVIHLPYTQVSSLRITPKIDSEFSCRVEATSGGMARTKTVLNLEYQNPTLAVVHQLDDRNTVAPEISLYDAKITYQWDLDLGQGSSLRTKVDPLADIRITWTDQSVHGGSWVTDMRLPLEGTTVQALAADVRVRRQFRF